MCGHVFITSCMYVQYASLKSMPHFGKKPSASLEEVFRFFGKTLAADSTTNIAVSPRTLFLITLSIHWPTMANGHVFVE